MNQLGQALKSAFDKLHRLGVEPPLDLIADYMLAVKDFQFFDETLRRLIRSLYNGQIGGEFTEILNNLIVGQIAQAYEQAWIEAGNQLPAPEYLRDEAQADMLQSQGYVQQLFRDIIDARVDQTGLDPLLARSKLWANRYNESKNNATALIANANGERMMWQLGPTEDHCETCAALNGKVAFASEWRASGFQPQNAPNALLECGGWNCGCELVTTDQRRSPNAMSELMNIAVLRSGI